MTFFLRQLPQKKYRQLCVPSTRTCKATGCDSAGRQYNLNSHDKNGNQHSCTSPPHAVGSDLHVASGLNYNYTGRRTNQFYMCITTDQGTYRYLFGVCWFLIAKSHNRSQFGSELPPPMVLPSGLGYSHTRASTLPDRFQRKLTRQLRPQPSSYIASPARRLGTPAKRNKREHLKRPHDRRLLLGRNRFYILK